MAKTSWNQSPQAAVAMPPSRVLIFMLAATLTQLVRTIITKIGGIAGAAWGDWFQLIFAIAMVVLAVILVIEGIGTFAKQNKQKA